MNVFDKFLLNVETLTALRANKHEVYKSTKNENFFLFIVTFFNNLSIIERIKKLKKLKKFKIIISKIFDVKFRMCVFSLSCFETKLSEISS